MQRCCIHVQLWGALLLGCFWGVQATLPEEIIPQGNSRQCNVAIIGGGIGGSFTAYFLRELLNDTVNIQVFEADAIGGRILDFEYDGAVRELGASMLYGKNYYVRDAAEKLGLRKSTTSGIDDLFAIFNGKEFVLQQSKWSALTALRILRRYGTAFLRFQNAPKATFAKFEKLYELQSWRIAFETPEAFLRALNLYEETQMSFDAYMEGLLGSGQFARRYRNEFPAMVDRINYNQRGSDLTALVGLISNLPAVTRDTFKIAGGNRQLPHALLRAANASVHEQLPVARVLMLLDGTFQLAYGGRPGQDPTAERCLAEDIPLKWDAVVVAAPLEQARLELAGFDVPHLPPRKYQRTVSTFVRGVLNPAYFGAAELPEGVMVGVTDDAETPFSVIAPHKIYKDGTTLYKLFSQEPLKPDDLASIFTTHQIIKEADWLAYPHYSPPESFAPFKLAPGLYYGNAIESAASAMEMSAIAAKNNALLVAEHLKTQVCMQQQGAPAAAAA